MGKFELTARGEFDSAHNLRQYQGKCANTHGHRWQVEVSVSGETLDELGMLVDFGVLKGILSELDHKHLNTLEPFTKINPTAENLAEYIGEELMLRCARAGKKVSLEYIKIWETPNNVVRWIP